MGVFSSEGTKECCYECSRWGAGSGMNVWTREDAEQHKSYEMTSNPIYLEPQNKHRCLWGLHKDPSPLHGHTCHQHTRWFETMSNWALVHEEQSLIAEGYMLHIRVRSESGALWLADKELQVHLNRREQDKEEPHMWGGRIQKSILNFTDRQHWINVISFPACSQHPNSPR